MTDPDEVVLDASALLTVLHREPGIDAVLPRLPRAIMSSVNLAEVIQKGLARGWSARSASARVESLGIRVLPFTAEDAEATAALWTETQRFGLSLGDRACLALAQRLGLPALTADRAWGQLQIGVEIEVIR